MIEILIRVALIFNLPQIDVLNKYLKSQKSLEIKTSLF